MDEASHLHSLKPSHLMGLLNISKSKAYQVMSGKKCASYFELMMSSLLSDKSAFHIELLSGEHFNYLNFYDDLREEWFWVNLLDILRHNHLDLKKLCEKLSLDSFRINMLSSKGHSLSLEETLKIATFLGLPAARLFDGNFDASIYSYNASEYFGRSSKLPSIYYNASGSKIELFQCAVCYVENKLGKKVRTKMLESMHINEKVFSFPEHKVSLDVFRVLHKRLRLLHIEDSFFVEMGANSVSSKRSTRMINQYHRVKSQRDFLIEAVLKIPRKMESNFIYYDLEAADDGVKFKSKPFDQNVQIDSFTDKNVSLFKLGHFIASPKYVGLPMCSFKKSNVTFDPSTGISKFYIAF